MMSEGLDFRNISDAAHPASLAEATDLRAKSELSIGALFTRLLSPQETRPRRTAMDPKLNFESRSLQRIDFHVFRTDIFLNCMSDASVIPPLNSPISAHYHGRKS